MCFRAAKITIAGDFPGNVISRARFIMNIKDLSTACQFFSLFKNTKKCPTFLKNNKKVPNRKVINIALDFDIESEDDF